MCLHAVYFYIFRVITIESKIYCTPSFNDKMSQEVYFIVVFVCLIALPACVVILVYSRITLTLNKNRTESGLSSCMTSERLREDMKVLRNISTIVVAFMICIIPINVYGFLFYFVWDWKMPCGMENFGFAALFILYLNACVNPCIYFTLNDKYQDGLLNILRVLRIVRNTAAVDRKLTKPVTAVELQTFLPNVI